jgi:hypothetical protein
VAQINDEQTYLGAMNTWCIDWSGWETAAPEFLSLKVKICMTFKTAKIYYYLSFLSVPAILFGILSLYLYKLFSVLCLEDCEQDESVTRPWVCIHTFLSENARTFLIMLTFLIRSECVYFEGRKGYWIKARLLVLILVSGVRSGFA